MIILPAIVLLLLGLALAAGGAWLASLGGSWFYVLCGVALVVVAVLLFRRRRAALHLYAAVVVATLAWALWEVGLDWWGLAPRGGLLILIGLWLLLPGVSRRLHGGDAAPNWRAAAGPLALATVAAIVVAGVSMTRDPTRIEGRLPTEAVGQAPKDAAPGEWPHYGRTLAGQRYSPLTQITHENVGSLEVAWTYRTGDLKRPSDVPETTYQVTPLKIRDTLYLCTPHHVAIALDAATGQEKWRFDSHVPENGDRQHQTCRGVSYAEAQAGPDGSCGSRIFLPTSDARLIALDAGSGKPCPGFGADGTVDLHANMPNPKPGYYYSTSPPVISDGLLIIGGAVNDNYSVAEPSGVIRAYDVNTGAPVWNWDSGNPDRTTPLGPGETYTANSPNAWAPLSADPALGLVYAPLGNKTPDQLGMDRDANVEKFTASIVALDIKTGQLRWVRQTVHHDLWDMDVPAQPSLVDVTTDKGVVPALVGPTKQGDVYVLDRRSGEPILPVGERPAPSAGALPEEKPSPTQPVSALSFEPEPLTEAKMWGGTLLDQLACRIQFRRLNYEGRYTPPSVKGTLVYPGNFGTFNWGGVAVDPVRQTMFGMPTYLAFTSQLVPRAEVPAADGKKGSEQGLNRNEGAPYAVIMGPFVSQLGIPCQQPPWGYVAGADLRTGKIAWKRKNGTVRDMTPIPLPLPLGVPGIGGPIITAGGVAFLGAAVDDYFRAYDPSTGEQLWEARLPAGGQATPMTYTAGPDDKQFVLIVAGGHGSVGTKPGDYVIAYALPKK